MTRIGIALLLGLASPLALAEGVRLESANSDKYKRPKSLVVSADAPEVWRVECGSCHMPFPPGLLPSEAWRQHMDTLSNHFGRNASLEPREEQLIREFLLVASSNNHRPVEGVVTPGEQPRVTQTSWFKRKHRKVGVKDMTLESVGIAGNCIACHRNVERGSFRTVKVPH